MRGAAANDALALISISIGDFGSIIFAFAYLLTEKFSKMPGKNYSSLDILIITVSQLATSSFIISFSPTCNPVKNVDWRNKSSLIPKFKVVEVITNVFNCWGVRVDSEKVKVILDI